MIKKSKIKMTHWFELYGVRVKALLNLIVSCLACFCIGCSQVNHQWYVYPSCHPLCS